MLKIHLHIILFCVHFRIYARCCSQAISKRLTKLNANSQIIVIRLLREDSMKWSEEEIKKAASIFFKAELQFINERLPSGIRFECRHKQDFDAITVSPTKKCIACGEYYK